MLDTSGRYLEADSEDVAEAWRTLLSLLRRSRPKVPLDGLIVAVPIDSLFGKSPEEMTTQAHTLRRRINEVTDTLVISGEEKTIDKGVLCDIAIRRMRSACRNEQALLIDNKQSNLDAWGKRGGVGYLYTTDGAFRRDVAGGIDRLIG